MVGTAYRPQSSGKVERMNRTLKNQLPLALLRVRSLPSKRIHLSPFEVMFGRPVPYVRMLSPIPVQDVELNNYVQSLSRDFLSQQVDPGPNSLRDQFEPGDEVWIRLVPGTTATVLEGPICSPHPQL